MEGIAPLVGWLCDKGGANLLREQDAYGRMPLYYALNEPIKQGLCCVSEDFSDTAFVAIKNGASVTERDGGLTTTLSLACRNMSTSVIQLIIETQGFGDLNVVNGKGRSPLWFSLLHDRFDLFQYLVLAGATIRATDLMEVGDRTDVIGRIHRWLSLELCQHHIFISAVLFGIHGHGQATQEQALQAQIHAQASASTANYNAPLEKYNQLTKLKGMGMTEARMKIAQYMGVKTGIELRRTREALALLYDPAFGEAMSQYHRHLTRRSK